MQFRALASSEVDCCYTSTAAQGFLAQNFLDILVPLSSSAILIDRLWPWIVIRFQVRFWPQPLTWQPCSPQRRSSPVWNQPKMLLLLFLKLSKRLPGWNHSSYAAQTLTFLCRLASSASKRAANEAESMVISSPLRLDILLFPSCGTEPI